MMIFIIRQEFVGIHGYLWLIILVLPHVDSTHKKKGFSGLVD